VFRTLKLRGAGGSIVRGYLDAAILGTWTIARTADDAAPRWSLSAKVERVDAYQIRQRPLYFTAPRAGAIGLWCWPVVGEVRVGVTTLTATLGHPEY
jgi:hypothetical protein